MDLKKVFRLVGVERYVKIFHAVSIFIFETYKPGLPVIIQMRF